MGYKPANRLFVRSIWINLSSCVTIFHLILFFYAGNQDYKKYADLEQGAQV